MYSSVIWGFPKAIQPGQCHTVTALWCTVPVEPEAGEQVCEVEPDRLDGDLHLFGPRLRNLLRLHA